MVIVAVPIYLHMHISNVIHVYIHTYIHTYIMMYDIVFVYRYTALITNLCEPFSNALSDLSSCKR